METLSILDPRWNSVKRIKFMTFHDIKKKLLKTDFNSNIDFSIRLNRKYFCFYATSQDCRSSDRKCAPYLILAKINQPKVNLILSSRSFQLLSFEIAISGLVAIFLIASTVWSVLSFNGDFSFRDSQKLQGDNFRLQTPDKCDVDQEQWICSKWLGTFWRFCEIQIFYPHPFYFFAHSRTDNIAHAFNIFGQVCSLWSF